MTGDRAAALNNFSANGGVIVSIRCLDEGVDIPVATHALILASSRNPREFIQRRGRVLRRAPGKAYAQIYDAIVVPRPPLDPSGRSMILGELARAASSPTTPSPGRLAANWTARSWTPAATSTTRTSREDSRPTTTNPQTPNRPTLRERCSSMEDSCTNSCRTPSRRSGPQSIPS